MITDKHKLHHLLGGRLLVRNAFVNLLGHGAPMVVAIFTIPLLIKGLGTDRFGILTLAWVVVGYFGLFDMGLGRALTKLVAEKIGERLTQEIPPLIWTALAVMGGAGLLGTALLVFLSPWLVETILKIPVLLQNETRLALYFLAISIPIVISTTGLRGVLEAYQRFDIINAVRVPMGFFTFLSPLIVLPFSKNLALLVMVLVAGRVAAWAVHLILCFRVAPTLCKDIRTQRSMIRPLVSFGSWITVSNIVAPLMLYLDRFFIANVLSVSAVAYYTTPYEIITKLLIIPVAVSGVMFPAFTSSFAQNALHVRQLYRQTMTYMSLIMFPIILFIYFFAERGLALWINADFAHNSFRVAQLLALGVFINSFGHIAQSLVQASGRPDLTAKLHLAELPLYLIYLSWLLSKYGISGAACAWLVRVTISTLVLAFLANRVLKEKQQNILRR